MEKKRKKNNNKNDDIFTHVCEIWFRAVAAHTLESISFFLSFDCSFVLYKHTRSSILILRSTSGTAYEHFMLCLCIQVQMSIFELLLYCASVTLAVISMYVCSTVTVWRLRAIWTEILRILIIFKQEKKQNVSSKFGS